MTEALKKVSSGFRLVYIGLLLVVLAVVIGIVGAIVLVGGAAGGGNVGGAMQMLVGLLVLVGGLSLAGKIIGLIGRFKCMAIPEKAGNARQMIVVSVAMEVVSLFITVVILINDLTGNFLDENARTIVNAGSVILSLISAVLFLLFCRSAADFVRRPDLAATAMSVLWLWVTTIVIYIAAVGIVALGGGAAARGAGANAGAGGACVGGILMIAALVIGIVALIRYASLLTGMAAATLRYAREGAYDYDDEDYDTGGSRGRGRDDYDDEEDRPRKKRRDETDEDDEDDRPRRKKRRDDDDWDS